MSPRFYDSARFFSEEMLFGRCDKLAGGLDFVASGPLLATWHLCQFLEQSPSKDGARLSDS